MYPDRPFPAPHPLAAAAALCLMQTLTPAMAPAHAQATPAAAPAASAPPAGARGSGTLAGDAAKPETVLPVVRARAAAEPQGRDGVQATTTRIGKGNQDLRDVPQSVTVVTERLLDDRNLDTMKDALRNTAGVTFLAAEGGEEDIRLRGFALQTTGDVFVDGMREPAFYDRDTFFLDRLELLRGSAGMLFGRGSTGGAVNQVTKVPRLLDEHQVDVTAGSHGHLRTVGDFNLRLGASSALRLGTMFTSADNNGAGSRLDKQGIAASWRGGIGERDEFSLALVHLENRNGINYGLPYVRPTAATDVSQSTLLPVSPTANYGMASDYNHSDASTLTLAHTLRLDRDSELVTRVRKGRYERDQRASTVRFAAAASQPGGAAASLATLAPNTVLTRGTQLKIQDMDTVFAQSDYSGKFRAFGLRHEVLAGIDHALERKRVYSDAPNLTNAQRTALYAALGLIKDNTTVGAPDDGASIDEARRQLFLVSRYRSEATGLYVQDLIAVAKQWKVLLGLRHDELRGRYEQLNYSYPSAPATPSYALFTPASTASYTMRVSELSKRAGLLYQPSERVSVHFAAATSFNTSGDAYSLSSANVDVPPEQSINVELGSRLDSADGDFTVRWAVFRTTKLHERNTDPTVNLVTLSGKRHVAGFELDLTGRLTSRWEVFGSYMWLPVAVIDQGVAGSEGQGTRPSLTPRHSGTIWSTYRVTRDWRIGAGLNARSSQTPNRNPGFAVPRYVTADLMAEVQAIPDKLLFKGSISNVTDKLYADALYTGHYVPGAGRLLALTGTYRF